MERSKHMTAGNSESSGSTRRAHGGREHSGTEADAGPEGMSWGKDQRDRGFYLLHKTMKKDKAKSPKLFSPKTLCPWELSRTTKILWKNKPFPYPVSDIIKIVSSSPSRKGEFWQVSEHLLPTQPAWDVGGRDFQLRDLARGSRLPFSFSGKRNKCQRCSLVSGNHSLGSFGSDI